MCNRIYNVYECSGSGCGCRGCRGGRFREPFPHVTHMCATVLTAGLWLPVWVLSYVVHMIRHPG